MRWWSRYPQEGRDARVSDQSAELQVVWPNAIAAIPAAELTGHNRALLGLTKPIGLMGTTALIAAPNNFTQNMIETRLRPALNRALSAALDRDVQIAVTVDASAMTDSSPADDAPPVPERRPDDRQL